MLMRMSDIDDGDDADDNDDNLDDNVDGDHDNNDDDDFLLGNSMVCAPSTSKQRYIHDWRW